MFGKKKQTVKITTDRQLPLTNGVPNIMLWGWIRSGLGLSGVDIMIYAYLFAIAGMNGNGDYVSMTELSNWVGISRQAISRRIDTLPALTKRQSQDSIDGRFYTHNHYTLDTDELLKLCSAAGSDIMEDFNNSIKHIITLYFPEERFKKVNRILRKLTKSIEKTFHDDEVSARTLIRVANILESMDNDHIIYKGEVYTIKKFAEICNSVRDSVTKEYAETHNIDINNFIASYLESVDDIIDVTDEDEVEIEEVSDIDVDSIINTVFLNTNIAEKKEGCENMNNTSSEVTTPAILETTTSQPVIVDVDNNIETSTDISTNTNTPSPIPTTPSSRKLNTLSGEALRRKLEKPNKPKPKTSSLLTKKEEKTKSSKITREQALDNWNRMSESFVALNCNGDAEILNMLKSYADTLVDMGSKKDERWQLILNGYKGIPVDVIREDLSLTVSLGWKSNGYKVQDYKKAQSRLKDIDALHQIADEYIETIEDCTPELDDYIHEYIDMLCNTSPYLKTPMQMKGILSALDKYPTVELKTEVVKNSFEGGYKKLYPTDEVKEIMKTMNVSNTSLSSIAVDMEEKKTIINNFVEYEYLFLYPDIKTNLLEYINSNVGKTITKEHFKTMLYDLLCYNLDNELADRIRYATDKQTNYFCQVDYNKRNKLIKKHGSLDDYIGHKRHYRKSVCITEYNRHSAKVKSLPTDVLDKIKHMMEENF